MADISFNEPQYRTVSRQGANSSLVTLVMRMGLAKDSASAQKVLLLIAIAFLALTAAAYFYLYPSTDGLEVEPASSLTPAV